MIDSSQICLEYEIDESEIQRFGEYIISGLQPSIIIGKAPLAKLQFVINDTDLSNYHRADSKTPILEFTIDLLQIIKSGKSGHLLEVGHLEGPGFLYLIKQSDEELLIQQPGDLDEFIVVPSKEMQIEAEKLGDRLFKELHDRSAGFRKLLQANQNFHDLMSIFR